MKSAKLRREDKFFDEIVETLKSVPKTRLRVVRDVVGALAEAPAREKAGKMLKRAVRKSLLKTPFCGMWQGKRKGSDFDFQTFLSNCNDLGG